MHDASTWHPIFASLLSLLHPFAILGEPARNVDYSVAARYGHETNCFTEGLLLNASGSEAFESCGLTGQSYVRRYNILSGQTLQSYKLSAEHFGEGVVLLGGSLFVNTWQHHTLIELDAATFTEIRRHPFPWGEGWGLTTDGCDLLATTGAPYIFRLRKDGSGNLVLVNQVQVTHDGNPLRNLNELEYVTPKLWINEWLTNRIWRVDPFTGICELQVNVQSLWVWNGEATPNGIAYDAKLGYNTLLVTGKLWPQMFLLQMSADDLCGEITEAAKASSAVTLLALSGQCSSLPVSACWRGSLPLVTNFTNNVTTIQPTATNDSLLNSQTSTSLIAVSGAAGSSFTSLSIAAATLPIVRSLPSDFKAVASVFAVGLSSLAVVAGFCIRRMRKVQRLTNSTVKYDELQ